MISLRSLPFETPQQGATSNAMRFTPVVHMATGEAHGLICDSLNSFGERVSFGPVSVTPLDANPAKWLGLQIEQMATQLAHQDEFDRPVLLAAPLTALAHSNTALACDAAVRRTDICHQEVCLEFTDAAFAGDPVDVAYRIGNLKRRGFRVGLDMRKSWTSPLSDAVRLLLDTLRVDARELSSNVQLLDTVLAATDAGVLVIAENAKWRDGQDLAALGIHVAAAPKADA